MKIRGFDTKGGERGEGRDGERKEEGQREVEVDGEWGEGGGRRKGGGREKTRREGDAEGDHSSQCACVLAFVFQCFPSIFFFFVHPLTSFPSLSLLSHPLIMFIMQNEVIKLAFMWITR